MSKKEELIIEIKKHIELLKQDINNKNNILIELIKQLEEIENEN